MSLILVVDDEPAVLRLVSTVLKRSGYEVIEAASGAEALLLYRSLRPDLVLCDVCMAEMDGVEFAARLRSEIDPQARIIFMTGYTTMETPGPRLTKPFSLAALNRAVADGLSAPASIR